MTMFRNIPFNFLSFSPKKTIITKHRTLQKYSTFAFNFPLMGPVSLVCLQPTSTLSAGNLIFTLYYTFYSAMVSLKWDGYCREWIVEGQKWETLKITHTIPSAPFCHITQKLSANRRAHRMKTCKCETDSQYLVQPCSGNTGWSLLDLNSLINLGVLLCLLLQSQDPHTSNAVTNILKMD